MKADSAVESSLISAGNKGGKRLYEKLCAQCHGRSGRPNDEVSQLLKPAPADLTKLELPEHGSDNLLRKRIGSGTSNNKLHYEGGLSEEQISALAAYVRTLVAK